MQNFQLISNIKVNGKVTTLILLKNKKDIAICTTNGFILVFNVKLFKQKLSKEIINKTILDIIEIKDKYCISCWDFNIRIIQFCENNTICNVIQTLNGHQSFINALKKLNFYKTEDVFASSANDGKIILWKYENNCFNKFQEIKYIDDEIEDLNLRQIEGIEESTKYQQLICSYSVSEIIFFCNLNNITEIVPLNIKVNRCIRALKIIENEDILLVAGNKEINVIDIGQKSILISIKYGIICEFNCIFQKKNGNLLITEYDDENITKIKEFKFDRKGLSLNLINMKENLFKEYITTIIELDKGDLIIGGYDGTFKFFKKLIK